MARNGSAQDRGSGAVVPRTVGEIGLVQYRDCQESAIHGLADIFRVASDYASAIENPASIRVSTWSIADAASGPAVVCTSDTQPESEHRIDHVILPPSLRVPELMEADERLSAWIRDQRAGGTVPCAVCAGVFVLAETGLLDGRSATTHWAFADELAAKFPAISVDADRMVIDDVDIVTAAGILAWVDLGLTLVERYLGPAIMLRTARFILADPPRRTQATYREFNPNLRHGDTEVLVAQHHVHTHYAEPMPLNRLAELAGIAPRTLQRRFKSATTMAPTEYIQAVRLAKAREELELTTRSVEQIARGVGYEDVSTFRRIFKRTTNLTPGQYREKFGV
ncbi:GlxA family transcriptional regulator [Gordonia phthalatica]|uniref:AraC family transcriptional regulator n=1 Tax=Gordonia phthalatica TaxID=1136941 RepID=A0A0N9NG33_9ACTN|nr:helix-turn-helix domain-containing protein [Gordonia phthalatica]ALG84656.1 AraC family transcriptional regulator [Gordonia phthalatica]